MECPVRLYFGYSCTVPLMWACWAVLVPEVGILRVMVLPVLQHYYVLVMRYDIFSFIDLLCLVSHQLVANGVYSVSRNCFPAPPLLKVFTHTPQILKLFSHTIVTDQELIYGRKVTLTLDLNDIYF